MFIPRQPVVENQFCSYAAQTASGDAGIGGVVCHAGAVVYLDPEAAGEEAIIKKMAHGVTEEPFGFSMQKVKTGYHDVHPAGFMMPGDLGSSDVIAQPTYDANMNVTGTDTAPVGIAHLGVWETTHYTCKQSVAGTVTTDFHMKPGMELFSAAEEAKMTNSDASSDSTDTLGERCSATVVAKVVTGASAAKCESTIAATTLYPIRVKLLV